MHQNTPLKQAGVRKLYKRASFIVFRRKNVYAVEHQNKNVQYDHTGFREPSYTPFASSRLDTIQDQWQISLELSETQSASLSQRVPTSAEYAICDTKKPATKCQKLYYINNRHR